MTSSYLRGSGSTVRVRRRALALSTAAALCAGVGVGVGAPAAHAAASLTVTTGSKQAGADTSLTIKTAVSGSFNANRQYGAEISLPSVLRVQFPAYGTGTQQCPPTSFSTLPSPITPGTQAFSDTNCPATAKIGTAKLGSATGSIYMVSSSPLPQMGVYFNAGVATPYGRRLSVSYTGSAPTLRIAGLVNAPSSGLTLAFDNPSRPTLPGKIWQFAQGTDPECTPASSVTGKVWTWPLSSTATTATTTTLAPKTLTVLGCGIGFTASTDTTVAGSSTALTLATTLSGTGNDAKQYGVIFNVPRHIVFGFPAYGTGSQMCSPTALTSLSTGYSPGTRAFSKTSCPATAKIGTATLGAATGSIYLVNTTPTPTHAVYFDSGVTTPYGRAITVTYSAEGAASLWLMGLPKQTSTGVRLVYDNPSRPTLPTKVWEFVQPDDPSCASATPPATSTVFTFPASGTVATASSQLWSYLPVTGCTG